MNFINREDEMTRLEKTASFVKKELLVLYGRRRLGKTTLLREFSRKHPSLFYSCPISTSSEALRIFQNRMAEAFEEPLLNKTGFSDWSHAIQYAFEQSASKKIPLIFDEFPYLLRSVPGIDSIIQHQWDLQEAPAWLALSGSLLSVMRERLLGSEAPLYGRRTEQIELKPMPFSDVSLFYPRRSFLDQAHWYAFFGGIPAYAERAAEFDHPRMSVSRLVLDKDGVLYQEPEFLVREELREPGAYFSILHSLASGCTRPNEIAQDAGVPHSGVNKYLDVLRRMQLVNRVMPITEKNPERSTKALYVLSDHFLRFWFRYVYPNRSVIELGQGSRLFTTKIQPDLDGFLGPVYEDMCRQEFLRRGRKLLGWDPFKVGRYWDSHNEIDIVIEDDSNARAAFIECKWGRKVQVEKVLAGLRKKADLIKEYAGAEKQCYVMSRTVSDHSAHIQFA